MTSLSGLALIAEMLLDSLPRLKCLSDDKNSDNKSVEDDDKNTALVIRDKDSIYTHAHVVGCNGGELVHGSVAAIMVCESSPESLAEPDSVDE